MYCLCCMIISPCYVQTTENEHYVNLTTLFYIKHIELRPQLHKCHKDCDSRRKMKTKNHILCFVERTSLYNFCQMKPTRCTLLCGWLSGLHTRQPPTQRKKYQCRIDTVSSPDDVHIVARNM